MNNYCVPSGWITQWMNIPRYDLVEQIPETILNRLLEVLWKPLDKVDFLESYLLAFLLVLPAKPGKYDDIKNRTIFRWSSLSWDI